MPPTPYTIKKKALSLLFYDKVPIKIYYFKRNRQLLRMM